MNSNTVPSFWDNYRKLDQSIKVRMKKAYLLWLEDPFHPSLRFKCINHVENIWAVRVTLGYRALGLLDDDTITWFWKAAMMNTSAILAESKRVCTY